MKKICVGLMLLITLISINFISASVITVCSPSGCNYTTIQAAINAANNGDIINVGAGTYNEDLKINESKSNLEIKSSVSGVVIKGVANVNQGDWPLAAPNIEILADNVKLHGFIIESPDYIALKYTSGIVVGGKNIEIYDNNFIINSAGSSDEISQVIQTYSSSARPGVDISGLNIHNNNFNHKGSLNWGYEGIYINPDTGSLIVYIKDNNFSGKILRAITSERSKVDIINNKIITDLAEGDLSSAGAYQGINIRRFDSGSQSNINIKNNIIKGSDSSKGFNQGIRLGQAGQTFSGINVENNTINYNKNGILVKIATGIIVKYNEIKGNLFGVKNDDGSNLNAEYNYWGACNGPSGVGTGSGDSVSANVDYIPWIGACVDSMTVKPDCIVSTNDVTLYANVSSNNSCIGKVLFSAKINGTWQNFTGIPTSGFGNYKYVLNSGLFTGNQLIDWRVYAQDCYGHISQSTVSNFNVKAKTELSLAPISPNGANNWYVTEPLFTLTNSNAVNFWYEWDGSGEILYATTFGLENIPGTPETPKESAGILKLTYWSDICTKENEQSKTFYIDLTSPNITNLKPIPDSIIFNQKPEIYAYIDERYQGNSGVDKNSIILKLDDNAVSPEIKTINVLNAEVKYKPGSELDSKKLHNVSLYVKDKAGRESSLTWFFNVSIVGPVDFNVSSPISKNYSSGRISIEVNVGRDVNLEYIDYNDKTPRWKLLCTSCSSYNKIKNFNDGKHNISIRAEDDFGNIGEKNIFFLVDSKEPKITKTAPIKNSFTEGSFEVEFQEENPQSLILHYGNDLVGYQTKAVNLNECINNRNTLCSINASLTDYNLQKIKYWFNLTDIAGKSDESKQVELKVDLDKPVINFFNYTIDKKRRLVNFVFSVSEPNLDSISYIDYNDRVPRLRILCSRLNAGICKKNANFATGSHNITIQVLDDAGNKEEIKNVIFVV